MKPQISNSVTTVLHYRLGHNQYQQLMNYLRHLLLELLPIFYFHSNMFRITSIAAGNKSFLLRGSLRVVRGRKP